MRSGRPCTQIFLLRSPDLPGVDKAALRKEVLDHVEQNSEHAACKRPCCTCKLCSMCVHPGTLRMLLDAAMPMPMPICMHACTGLRRPGAAVLACVLSPGLGTGRSQTHSHAGKEPGKHTL